MPKISYLVSTYDAATYLDIHIRHLLDQQTEPDFEIIVINPNSPGDDREIALTWASRDNRVRYIEHSERETYGCSWLRGWKQAKAPFVCNSNTDDFHSWQFTEAFIHNWSLIEYKLAGKGDTAFMYAGIVVVDENRRIKGGGIRPPFDAERFQTECDAGPQVCWRNDEEFLAKLNWDLMWERAAQHVSAFDYWLWLYFMSLGYNGYCIQEQLTYYTQRAASIENSMPKRSTYESLASISEFFPHHFQGKLKCYKEFADFNNLPPKDEWISHATRGKKWRG